MHGTIGLYQIDGSPLALDHLLEAIEELSDGFVIFDDQNQLVACNRRYIEIYQPASRSWSIGTTLETIARDTAMHCVGIRNETEVEEWVSQRLQKHRRSASSTTLQRFENGRWVQVNEKRLSNGWSVGIRVDVTALKRSEEQLRKMFELVESASHSKSVFLAKVSHEMRTPLNAIIGFSALMEAQISGPIGNEKYESYVADIHQSATYLLDLINSVLELSRSQPDTDTRSIQNTDCLEDINFCIKQVEASAALKNQAITLETHPSSDKFHARIDQTSFRQIVTNLLVNAMKFSNENAQIRLALRRYGDRRISFSVADSGVGIAQHDIARILLPFEQACEDRDTGSRGVGLGLSIVANHCEAYGGLFKIRSRLGAGTVARISLPASK